MSDAALQSEPWERQPGEPNLWYARFERYRLAGPARKLLTTINDEREERGKKPTKVHNGAWSKAFSQWCWRERAEAWDEHERQRLREAHAAAIDEMNRRQIEQARALQDKAIERLKSLTPDALSPGDLLRYILDANKLERTARGEPDTIGEHRVTGKGGGAVIFTLEDALAAEKELEKWKHDRMHANTGAVLQNGNSQVP